MAKGSNSSSKAVLSSPDRMWWERAGSSLWNEEFQKLVCSAALEADRPEPNSEPSSGRMSSYPSTMGSRAFISETTTTSEEGSGKKVQSGVKQNHWILYEMLWNYCTITRAFLSMKKCMSRKKPHLHEIVNKANVFNLEAAMKFFNQSCVGVVMIWKTRRRSSRSSTISSSVSRAAAFGASFKWSSLFF